MATVSERAEALYKLHKERGNRQAAFNESERAYFAADGGDKKTAEQRTQAADRLNESIAAAAELRRLAAAHPGYFREGWRETEDMIPIPLTEDERLTVLKRRAEVAKADDAQREKNLAAERKKRLAEKTKTDQAVREERARAAQAAGQIQATDKGD